MKKDLHPKDYRFVVFQDVSCNYSFLTKSTIATKETIKWEDGNEYPHKLDISSKSHPYFTGQQNLVDTFGELKNLIKNIIYKTKSLQIAKLNQITKKYKFYIYISLIA